MKKVINQLRKIIFFSKIIWRKWDEFKCDKGYRHIFRIDIKTAWRVAGIVYNKKEVEQPTGYPEIQTETGQGDTILK